MDKETEKKRNIAKPIKIYRPRDKNARIPTDVLGSYTGNSLFDDEPTQDADDL